MPARRFRVRGLAPKAAAGRRRLAIVVNSNPTSMNVRSNVPGGGEPEADGDPNMPRPALPDAPKPAEEEEYEEEEWTTLTRQFPNNTFGSGASRHGAPPEVTARGGRTSRHGS